MRDADLDVLARDLREAMTADASATVVPPAAEVRARGVRRRQRRAASAMAVAVLLVGGVVGVGWSAQDGTRDETVAAPTAPQELVLDRGEEAAGPWRIVASREDGYCIQRIHPTGSGGACGLTVPALLSESTRFDVDDAGTPVTVVAGPAPDRTAEIAVELADGSTVRTEPVPYADLLVYGVRLPPGGEPVAVEARDAGGTVLARAPLPPGGPVAPPVSAPPQDPMVSSFRAFAAQPTAERLAALPLGEDVDLGIGAEISTTVPRDDLLDPAAWVLPVETYGGLLGPFSALDELADPAPVAVSVGPHPHCASPPRPAPSSYAGAGRVSVQPTQAECLGWYTVDLFVVDGLVEAVTVDYWEP